MHSASVPFSSCFPCWNSSKTRVRTPGADASCDLTSHGDFLVLVNGGKKASHNIYKEPVMGLPHGSVVKNPPVSAGNSGWVPLSWSSPGEGNGSPLQCSCCENLMDRGGYSPLWSYVGGLQSMGSQRVRHHWTTEHEQLWDGYNMLRAHVNCLLSDNIFKLSPNGRPRSFPPS